MRGLVRPSPRGACGVRPASLAVVAGTTLALLLAGCGHPSEPKKQVAKITLLPDQPPPPPPPPPPKEEKQPEPKEQVKTDTPKPDKPPEPAPVKMEGPAGDAPSPFQGGKVNSDYVGGDVGNGDPNARFEKYIDSWVQEIRDRLQEKNAHGGTGRVLLWINADGTLKDWKIVKSSGDVDSDQAIKTCLADLHRMQDAPPSDMPMPVGLDVSMH